MTQAFHLLWSAMDFGAGSFNVKLFVAGMCASSEETGCARCCVFEKLRRGLQQAVLYEHAQPYTSSSIEERGLILEQ